MKRQTPIKAIRSKCLDCCNGSPYEVRKCVIPKCPLWPYRLGKRPTEEVYKEQEKKIEEV